MEKKAKKLVIGIRNHKKLFFSLTAIHNIKMDIKEKINEWMYAKGVPDTG